MFQSMRQQAVIYGHFVGTHSIKPLVVVIGRRLNVGVLSVGVLSVGPSTAKTTTAPPTTTTTESYPD